MTARDFRKDLHRIPEIGYRENETKKYILSVLDGLGCEIFHIKETGIAAFFDFGRDSALCIRADMDALQIKEETGLPFASAHEGFMHACGHDGHMAMALEAALYTAELKKSGAKPKRNVVFVFQPAEELDGGARYIVGSGVLRKLNVTCAFGIHLWPELTKGEIFSKSGAMMAKSSETDIVLRGKASHIADMGKGADSLMAAAELLLKLRDIEAKRCGQEKCVVKFGKMRSGSLRNIISDNTVMQGSVRVLSENMFSLIKGDISAAAEEVSEKYGVTAEINMGEGYPPVINDGKLFDMVRAVCDVKILPDAVMQAEDFSFYARVCPTAFFFLGLGSGMKLHSEKFDFDMSVLDVGVNLYKQLISSL